MKKGISPLIATVLLIMLSIAAVAMIVRFVFPFVNDSLKKSKLCYEAAGQIKFNTEEGYGCYNPTLKIINISVERAEEESELIGFNVVISDEKQSESFNIKEGKVSNVKMLKKDPTIPSYIFVEDLEIPKKGEMRTYQIDMSSLGISLDVNTNAKISPIMEGDVRCDKSDEINLEQCQ